MPVRLRLKELVRQQKGWTLKDLCYELDVDYQTVANWNQGRVFPNLKRVLAICLVLQCSLDELIEWDTRAPHLETYRKHKAEGGLKQWVHYVNEHRHDSLLWNELVQQTLEALI